MTLSVQILHAHRDLIVKVNDQKLPIQRYNTGDHFNSGGEKARCEGVIDDVPAGAVISVFEPDSIRHFRTFDADARLAIRVAEGPLVLTGGIEAIN